MRLPKRRPSRAVSCAQNSWRQPKTNRACAHRPRNLRCVPYFGAAAIRLGGPRVTAARRAKLDRRASLKNAVRKRRSGRRIRPPADSEGLVAVGGRIRDREMHSMACSCPSRLGSARLGSARDGGRATPWVRARLLLIPPVCPWFTLVVPFTYYIYRCLPRRRFARVLQGATSDEPVPSCPRFGSRS
jgi:hypothetical protein